MSEAGIHGEWLSLLDVSGPFLALPVLKEAMPQGLAGLDADTRKIARQAYAEWSEAFETEDKDRARIHDAWIEFVLGTVLFYRAPAADFLKSGDGWKHYDAEHGVTLTPDYVLTDGQDKPLLLVAKYPQEISLEIPSRSDRWAASPIERMVELCRATGVRLGLVTNGERWTLVDAGTGVTSIASWYARLWSQEPLTLQAFVDLLGIRRFFAGEGAALARLLDKSLSLQDEVTDALGEQVRRAVEVLVQSLDRADQDRNRELLKDVTPAELYEAGLTIMMRIVFLLSAEERGLLLMGDETYETNYAVSTLRLQLRSEAEEILERRWDAWSRLLSLFRAIFAGIDHDALRLPALGGSLFDPDRFPFLEGRAKGSKWATDAAVPLPIDNRTVLLLLEAVQLFQGRALSYLALDVEQIGYVYEGLLERTVIRAAEPTLDLAATKSSDNPWVTLAELDDAAAKGEAAVQELLKERTGSSANRIKNALAEPIDEASGTKLLAACQADPDLKSRMAPYFHLLRTDSWGYPLVYPKGTFMVASGSDRRETGTHYTPKSFTESIVKTTLEPIVYDGPSQGAEVKDWKLKTPGELLDLKICDPAMGSGAFLVQVCRYLGERLVEAWNAAEWAGKAVSAEGDVSDHIGGSEPMSRHPEERQTIARRLIAERCLYGVDMNPLAVELAKLSLWLVTLAKGRPFGFLDHNLRCGDSLLGIHHIDQLNYLDLKPSKGSKKLFAAKIDEAVQRAIELRSELRSRPVMDIQDVQIMATLDERARSSLHLPTAIADAFIGEILIGDAKKIDITSVSIDAGAAIHGTQGSIAALQSRALQSLTADQQKSHNARKPLHWPLEFPEVFARSNGGFDAIVGNPPFLGAMRIARSLGDLYQRYLKKCWDHRRGAADLIAYFFLRSFQILRRDGSMGMIATNTLAQGNTKVVGLQHILELGGTIHNCVKSTRWPGSANVFISIAHIWNGIWRGRCVIDGDTVATISSSLDAIAIGAEPHQLANAPCYASRGTTILGIGFVVTKEEANKLRADDKRNADVIFPYLNAVDFSTTVDQSATREVINFFEWSLEKAQSYNEPFKIVEDRVKPQRQRPQRQVHEADFWKFSDKRPELYRGLSTQAEALVCGLATKYFSFSFVPSKQVFADKVGVFCTEDRGLFAVLSSFLHEAWATHFMYTLKGDPCYSLTGCFRTFPFCTITDNLRSIGQLYHRERADLMTRRGEGLTKLNNSFHNPKDEESDIKRLRNLQAVMDKAVAEAYGWHDFEWDHAFYPVGGGVRYSASSIVRSEVLGRLSKLNETQHARPQPALSAVSRKTSQSAQPSGSGDLFEASPTQSVDRLSGGKN